MCVCVCVRVCHVCVYCVTCVCVCVYCVTCVYCVCMCVCVCVYVCVCVCLFVHCLFMSSPVAVYVMVETDGHIFRISAKVDVLCLALRSVHNVLVGLVCGHYTR